MKLVKVVAVAAGAIGGWIAAGAMQGASAPETHAPEAPMHEPAKEDAAVLEFTMNLIDGTPKNLADYKGKVVVIVNVASKCGFTPQYKALEELYKKHKDEGLVILGFPADNFNHQEPGTNDEIAAFCEKNFGVTFPLFAKISVKGEDQHPLYKKLSALPAPLGGDPKWNFTKFVVDRTGKVVARADAAGREGDRAKLEPKLVEAVERLLAEKGAVSP